MRPIVLADDFLNDNYLSTELRVPCTLMQTNACSPIATNAIAGNIWDNFSSESYKELPSVGTMKVRHPSPARSRTHLPGGGRGFTRPASLVSAWSTAPFLQNNTVGRFDPSPSVEARMRVFQDSIEQMLWPERREKDPIFGNETGPASASSIARPGQRALGAGRLRPDGLRGLLGARRAAVPGLFENGEVQHRADSEGTPVSLLANVDLLGADMPHDRAARRNRRSSLELLARTRRTT